MAKNVTLADIAAKVGVSNVAVYKALTGKPGVSARLREEIIRLAEEMGYTAPERGQNARKTGNIRYPSAGRRAIFRCVKRFLFAFPKTNSPLSVIKHEII